MRMLPQAGQSATDLEDFYNVAIEGRLNWAVISDSLIETFESQLKPQPP